MPTFVDQTKIEVQAGKGGDGMVAFRHEKYVPNGGPAGGDGGRGGSIIFVADSGLRTLMDFRYRRKFKADNGENGRIKSQYGRAAKDLYLKVPVGTTVYDFNTGELIGDLVKKGQELVVAHGGRGGRGNIHFATSVNTAPEIAENGEPGDAPASVCARGHCGGMRGCRGRISSVFAYTGQGRSVAGSFCRLQRRRISDRTVAFCDRERKLVRNGPVPGTA